MDWETDNVFVIAMTVIGLAFLLLMGYFAYGSDQRFEVCVKAGHSWIEGNCIIKDIK